jgi:transcriptional regulator with XRE-family HTH domain
MNTGTHDTSSESRNRVASLIRGARTSIDPFVTMLGPIRRLDSRIGRPITQDEVAEASGISRQWYATLEQGAPVNVSLAVLDRIACVLELDGPTRSELFALCFPEVTRVFRTEEAASPLVGSIAMRLAAAKSELEAIAITAKALLTLLGRVDWN